jgi:hypothetical protein
MGISRNQCEGFHVSYKIHQSCPDLCTLRLSVILQKSIVPQIGNTSSLLKEMYFCNYVHFNIKSIINGSSYFRDVAPPPADLQMPKM